MGVKCSHAVDLQIALDLLDLDTAVDIALAVHDVADRLEVGTPLLRKYGMRSIERIREALPTTVLVADCKTMDRGGTDALLTLESGANGLIVAAAAPRSTLVRACTVAQEHGGFVMADSLGLEMEDLQQRLYGLQITSLILHKGKDEQNHDDSLPISALKTAERINGLPQLAYAGGISSLNAAQLLPLTHIKLWIVGEAIVKADAPRDIAERIYRLAHGADAIECP